MRFNLNSKWAVITETDQVTIAKRNIIQKEGKNKGNESLAPCYYYNNLEEALKGLIDRDINDLEKLEEVVSRIEELKTDLKTMLKRAK